MNHYNPMTGSPMGPAARTSGRSMLNDFGAFTGMNMRGVGSHFRNLSPNGRRMAGGMAGAFGFAGRNSQFASNSFNLMGKQSTWGRAGVTAGMGMLALRNGANMIDRMRYGDYGGAMLSGAMTAAAGYGAYKSWMYKGSMRSNLTKAASRALMNIR